METTAQLKQRLDQYYAQIAGNATIAKSHVKTYTRKDGTIVKEHDDSRSKKTQPAPTGHHHNLVALLRKRKAGDDKKPKGRIGHPMALLRTVAKKKVEPEKDAALDAKKADSKPRKPKETAAATRKRIEAEIRGGEPRHVLGEIHYVKKSHRVRHLLTLIKSHVRGHVMPSGRMSADYERHARRMGKMLDSHRETLEHRVIDLFHLNRSESAKIKRLTGEETEGYVHRVGTPGFSHVLRRHGEGREQRHDQEPLTDTDIERIPLVVGEADSMTEGDISKRGNKTVVFTKKFEDGTIHYVAEIFRGGRYIANLTMFKKKS